MSTSSEEPAKRAIRGPRIPPGLPPPPFVRRFTTPPASTPGQRRSLKPASRHNLANATIVIRDRIGTRLGSIRLADIATSTSRATLKDLSSIKFKEQARALLPQIEEGRQVRVWEYERVDESESFEFRQLFESGEPEVDDREFCSALETQWTHLLAARRNACFWLWVVYANDGPPEKPRSWLRWV